NNLKAPRVNMLEAWGEPQDEKRMRAVTTLAMTVSNGYALYSLPNGQSGLPDHVHSWRSFWDKGLGKPLSAGSPVPGGRALRRGCDEGSVVRTPPAAGPAAIVFPEQRLSRATGKTGKEFVVAEGDGDIFTKP